MKEQQSIITNMEPARALELKNLVPLEAGSIVSKILVQNDAVSLTLFSFGKGQAISTHEADGDALVSILEGQGTLTIDGEEHVLKAGESILMKAHHPHSLFASEDFKMLLTVVYPF
jgi:quercetin dioxygenase-like cupin family protein